MRKNFNKLIRNRIPEVIRAEGKNCEFEVLNDTAYLAALLQKLIEEAQELAAAPTQRQKEEIADVLEVVDAIIAALNYNYPEIREEQRKKQEQYGGFSGKIKLLWVE